MNYTLDIFKLIFEYGNENSGELMYKRFTEQYNSNADEFINDLCQIDRAKWDLFFYAINDLLQKLNTIKQKRTAKNCTDCDFNIAEKCKISGLIISPEFAQIRCAMHSHYLS